VQSSDDVDDVDIAAMIIFKLQLVFLDLDFKITLI
jgi:hypothetical protein